LFRDQPQDFPEHILDTTTSTIGKNDIVDMSDDIGANSDELFRRLVSDHCLTASGRANA
jgi:hypothetical protein